MNGKPIERERVVASRPYPCGIHREVNKGKESRSEFERSVRDIRVKSKLGIGKGPAVLGSDDMQQK